MSSHGDCTWMKEVRDRVRDSLPLRSSVQFIERRHYAGRAGVCGIAPQRIAGAGHDHGRTDGSIAQWIKAHVIGYVGEVSEDMLHQTPGALTPPGLWWSMSFRSLRQRSDDVRHKSIARDRAVGAP